MSPSEEATKTWLRNKELLQKSRPTRSRFSFAVCLSLVSAIAFGFLSGFVTAGFTLNENYSVVYENLLAELEHARSCLEREKEQLASIKDLHVRKARVKKANAEVGLRSSGNQVHNQAIFSVFGHAVEMFNKNEKIIGCKMLKNIVHMDGYNTEIKLKNKVQKLINSNCN